MVSASRKAGRTEWVHLTATVAGKFSFTVPDDAAGWGAVAPRSRPSSVKVSRSTKNESSWSVTLAAGKSVALWPAGEPQPPFIIAPLAGNPKEFNYWGYNHDMLPLHTDDDASTARDATDNSDNMPCCDDNSLPMYGSMLKFEDGSNISSHMICHHIKTDDDRASSGTATPGAATTTSAQNHLTVMSFYGFDAPKMQGWVNLGMEGEGGLEAKLDAWTRYKIPSLYGKLPSSEVHGCTDAVGGIFQFGHGLCPGWEASLEALAKNTILPNFGPDKALRGVFVGDELCCRNVTCWQSGLAPVAKKIRSLLGPEAIIYTNGGSTQPEPIELLILSI